MFFINPSFSVLVFSGITGTMLFPVIYSLLNQEKNEEHYLFREYKTPSQNDNLNFEIVKKPYIDLIKGDINYNNGNYVMYVGSEFCKFCNDLLYSEKTITEDSDKKLLFTYSRWNKAYEYGQEKAKLNNTQLKFIMYSDKLITTETSKKTLPRKTNTENNVNNGQIKDDYVRYDESAVNFRKIWEQLEKYIGKNKIEGIPTVIFYREAKPLVWGKDTFQEIETKDKLWEEMNKDKKDTEKVERNVNPLIEFMHYYYNKRSTKIIEKT